MTDGGWEQSWRTEQTVEAKELKSHFLSGLESGACSVLMFVISPSLRCCCSAFPAGLAQAYSWTSLLWSDAQWPALQLLTGYIPLSLARLCLTLRFFLSAFAPSQPVLPFFFFFYSCLSLFLSLSLFLLLYFLTHYLPLSHLHPFILTPPFHISLSLSPSHTPVATLKTVVTMVTAMCCGNVKEPNPPRITSLFDT